MPRRFEIELTSRTGDGTFTWRVAGAKQPRGVVAESLLPPGSAVGDVLRAELESGIEGVEVVNLQPRTERADAAAPNRIEVLGVARRGPDVSVTYAPGTRRRRDDTDDDRPARGGRQDRPGRRDGRRPAGGGPSDRPRRPGRAGEAGPAPEGESTGTATGTAAGSEAGAGDRSDRSDRRDRSPRGGEGAERRGRRSAGAGEGEARGGPARRERDRRPPVSTAHRNAILATLGPQELPIAEQLLRGGIPAVRQAIADQIAAQRGGPAVVNSDAVLAIAEQLLPKVNLASWKDRATAAQAAGRDLRLRELRAVVTASRTVSLDDEGRAMGKALHESLDQRVKALREEWISRLTRALDEGRVAEALVVCARPPEPATRLPAELAVRLAEAAGAAMTAQSDPEDWQQLLDAVVESPVRRTVKPQGIPPVREAHEAALRAAGSVPELAKLLGLRIPPPPPRRLPIGGRPIPVGGAARAAGR